MFQAAQQWFKRHKHVRRLTIFLVITIVICFLCYNCWGILTPPSLSNYTIGQGGEASPFHALVSIYEDDMPNSETFNLIEDQADKLTEIIRKMKNQRIVFFSQDDTKFITIQPYHSLYFYPNCYTNKNSKINYTCDNYEDIFNELFETVKGMEMQRN